MTKIVAAIQMNSSTSVADNLSCAADLIAQAAALHASLVVLPEMFALMTVDLAAKQAISEELGAGPIQEFLMQQARTHQIWLAGGTIPIRGSSSDKAYAACLLYNAQGEVVAQYNKMHLFDVKVDDHHYQESSSILAGDSVVVVDTPVGKLGLAVCYDIRFPELFRLMFNQGAEIFAVSAAFTATTGKAHWEVLCRSRAIENFSYLIGACQVGHHDGKRQTHGHSLIVDPWGEIVALQAQQVGVIVAEVAPSHMQDIRRRIPVQQHQKIFHTR